MINLTGVSKIIIFKIIIFTHLTILHCITFSFPSLHKQLVEVGGHCCACGEAGDRK